MEKPVYLALSELADSKNKSNQKDVTRVTILAFNALILRR